MSALVTDNFRIQNASNFIDAVLNGTDNYYAFLGLANPNTPASSFGRDTDSKWNNVTTTPSPVDNLAYLSHYRDTSLFGKKITGDSIRRVVKKHQWTANTRYDMYRHDYNIESNRSPVSNKGRLYDSNYYVVNSDFKVYICLYNGSSGAPGSDSSKGVESQDEPTFTDLEPSAAGTNDKYIWKYLFTIAPSDIVKFDSTEYIVLPNNWDTSTDSQIQTVREAGDSVVNNNQIKRVYIESGGLGYEKGTYSVDILGDGTGAKATVSVNSSGTIDDVIVTSGGSGYTYGIVDLGSVQAENRDNNNRAKLIPIIPPSRGHGFDIYSELGGDKVLVYSRFDNSTKDFPTETKFSQVGILKNPMVSGSYSIKFTNTSFSSLYSIKLTSIISEDSITVGDIITQTRSDGDVAKGYVASFDKVTKVLKYFIDRTLFFDSQNKHDQTDYTNVSTESKHVAFDGSASISIGSATASVDTSFGASEPTNTVDGINLGVSFNSGLANPEINRKTGDIIYINNRPVVTRDSRQKEDVKIILEF
jgi:hypothetical protein